MSWFREKADKPWRQVLADEPYHHSFLWALMRHEALAPNNPRIGDSATRREEFIDLGQEPHLDFPASNVVRYEPTTDRGKPLLRVRFLGMLGPMGPLPSALTDEALGWYSRRDEAFVRFLDIFNNRFLQLFYRAFADAHPAPQALRPADDRFRDYVGSAIGIGTHDWRDLDGMPDYQKLAFAGLIGKRATSASQIESVVMGVFGIASEVEEFVGARLSLDPSEQSRLGAAHASLGESAMLGATVISVDTKFRLRLFPDRLESYREFLPGGAACERLVAAMTNVVGFEYEWDVELVLPADEVRPTQLGTFGRLGWTSWMRKPGADSAGATVKTRFQPVDENGLAA